MNRTEASFDGLAVASFESRRADDMVRLIQRSGGIPHVSPSMREVAIVENREAVDFAKAVMTGEIDLVIFMTGVGFRHLIGAVERQVDLQRFLATLSDIVTIARGPKPVVAMKEHGLAPTHLIPSPNTWREVLTEIDKHIHVANQNIGLQEYGKTNASLIAGLEARGATVKRVRVYDWDFPENIELLKTNVHALAAREIDVVLFTSANQLIHLMQLATQMELADEVRNRLGASRRLLDWSDDQRNLAGLWLASRFRADSAQDGPVSARGGRGEWLAAGAKETDPADTLGAGQRRDGSSSALVRQSFHARLSLRANRRPSSLADAAGRSVLTRVPRNPR